MQLMLCLQLGNAKRGKVEKLSASVLNIQFSKYAANDASLLQYQHSKLDAKIPAVLEDTQFRKCYCGK